MTDQCICCGSPTEPGLCRWHRVCISCSYESGKLDSHINEEIDPDTFDEQLREVGLIQLRTNNFKQLLEQIVQYTPHGSTLLDVGCAHGWFLGVVHKTLKAEGIEPDRAIYERTLKDGFKVRYGYFPQDLNPSDVYDVIIFNDVIEHIPDINHTLASSKKHLNNNGLLVLNLPDSNGIFYRLSKILYYLGIHSFFNRLWQSQMPSPHVHYFNSNNLMMLLHKTGFKVKKYGRLESIVLRGLYERISYARTNTRILNTLIYIFVACFLPVLRLLPSDIIYIIATKD